MSMAEQSVDIVILKANAVHETLPKDIIEAKIAEIKEEKKKEMEEKGKEKEEEVDMNCSVC